MESSGRNTSTTRLKRRVVRKERPTSTRQNSQLRQRRLVVRRSVKTKVKRLQKIVPGGKGLEPDRLFLQTANYILHLRLQVNMLEAISKLYKP
ncbi:hypothetical protein ACHQM5_007019 [Ranunculus cassubicifolius]